MPSKKHTKKKRIQSQILARRRAIIRRKINKQHELTALSGNVYFLISILTLLDTFESGQFQKYAFNYALSIAPVNFEMIIFHVANSFMRDPYFDMKAGVFDLMGRLVKNGMNLFPKRPILKILSMDPSWSKTSRVPLPICVQNVIVWLLECDLDILTDHIFEELLKYTQCPNWFIAMSIYDRNPRKAIPKKKFLEIIFHHANIDSYLTHLRTWKSRNLTQWFHPPKGFIRGRKLNSNVRDRSMWTTRLLLIAEHSDDLTIWNRIFKILFDLAKSNLKFRESETFKIGVLQLIHLYSYTFTGYDNLYTSFQRPISDDGQKLSVLDLRGTHSKYIDSIFWDFSSRRLKAIAKKMFKAQIRMTLYTMIHVTNTIAKQTSKAPVPIDTLVKTISYLVPRGVTIFKN